MNEGCAGANGAAGGLWIVKTTFLAIVGVCVFALAGCQGKMTLEEAQAACTKKGGLLVVIYSQKITAAGPGEEVALPGDCISPSKFDATPAPPAPAD